MRLAANFFDCDKPGEFITATDGGVSPTAGMLTGIDEVIAVFPILSVDIANYLPQHIYTQDVEYAWVVWFTCVFYWQESYELLVLINTTDEICM